MVRTTFFEFSFGRLVGSVFVGKSGRTTMSSPTQREQSHEFGNIWWGTSGEGGGQTPVSICLPP